MPVRTSQTFIGRVRGGIWYGKIKFKPEWVLECVYTCLSYLMEGSLKSFLIETRWDSSLEACFQFPGSPRMPETEIITNEWWRKHDHQRGADKNFVSPMPPKLSFPLLRPEMSIISNKTTELYRFQICHIIDQRQIMRYTIIKKLGFIFAWLSNFSIKASRTEMTLRNNLNKTRINS